mgnify:CR=1 FL=1
MASNDIIHAPLNEAIDLIDGIDDLPNFEKDCYELASDHGWQFGGTNGEALSRQFDCLVLAVQYISSVRKAHGLRTLDPIIHGLNSGREDADLRLRESGQSEPSF